MNNSGFLWGMAAGMTAGVCVGMKMRAKEKKIRRVIDRTARSMENAFDCMNH